MMTGWFKNLLALGRPEQITQGAQAFDERKKKKAKLVDITDPSFLEEPEEARTRRMALMDMVRKGGVQIDRLRAKLTLRRSIKDHVRENIADCYDMPDITEEVTEKIIAAAQEDPRLRKMFG